MPYSSKYFPLLILFLIPALIIFLHGCTNDKPSSDQPTPSAHPPKSPDSVKSPATTTNPRVKLQTSLGDIILELNPKLAPKSVENFLRYVNEGYYDGTIFHRVIPGFIIQGGSSTLDLKHKTPHPPIVSEAKNGLKNLRGSLALARTPVDPNSATSQFYINLQDNASLDYGRNDPQGYAVFGSVVQGLDIADKIGLSPTVDRGITFNNLPIQPIIIQKAALIPQKP